MHDASIVDDEVAGKTWIAEEFRRQDERWDDHQRASEARMEAMVDRKISQATWRWMGLMVAQTGLFVALVPLLT